MRNRAATQKYLFHVSLRVLGCFRDRICHFVGLAKADTYVAIAIANGDNCIEAESATALDYFGDAVNGDKCVF